MHLHAFTRDEPFSMIFLDMWKPGNVPEKSTEEGQQSTKDKVTKYTQKNWNDPK
jgi:hypothetical protein